MERRLAAVLAADVVGYTRLMGSDEAGTLERLKAHREALFEPVIASHQGRIVKLMGDGVLVEFASVVNAVSCATDLQRGMAERNASVPNEDRIQFRIGINLGDIIIEDDDLYGDGVNVAARLEGLAEPGGICVSAKVYQEVKTKLDLVFEDLGFKDLKNVAEPLHAYGISLGGHVGTAGLVMKEGPAPTDQVAIAVLPFANMSGDPDQEYFSDGITEDIITELSRFKNLFVIARNSSFHYKGQSPKIQDVGRDLGIQYIVEGSVRKVRNRVRVTAQLTETERGSHLWAERYDRDLEDIFAVQDELVREIAATVPGQLDAVAAQRARHRSVENLTAYDYLLRGEWLAREDLGSREALALFEKAIEIDPHSARAYTRLAVLHAYSVFSQGVPVQTATQMAQSFSQRALEIDPIDPTNHAIVAEAYILVGEHDLARHHIERAIKLNPNDYNVMINAGRVLAYLGDHGEGLWWLNKLKRHDPFYGDACREAFFDLFYMCRDYEAAIAMFRGWRDPPWQMYSELAAAYAQLGLMDQSQTAMTTWQRMRPKVYDPVAEIQAHARMCARLEDRENWLEGYRKAGFEV